MIILAILWQSSFDDFDQLVDVVGFDAVPALAHHHGLALAQPEPDQSEDSI